MKAIYLHVQQIWLISLSYSVMLINTNISDKKSIHTKNPTKAWF